MDIFCIRLHASLGQPVDGGEQQSPRRRNRGGDTAKHRDGRGEEERVGLEQQTANKQPEVHFGHFCIARVLEKGTGGILFLFIQSF